MTNIRLTNLTALCAPRSGEVCNEIHRCRSKQAPATEEAARGSNDLGNAIAVCR